MRRIVSLMALIGSCASMFLSEGFLNWLVSVTFAIGLVVFVMEVMDKHGGGPGTHFHM